MLTSEQKKLLERNLSECENVQEMFNLLSNTFDLRKCKPGSIAKPAFIKGIMQGISMLNPKLKQ